MDSKQAMEGMINWRCSREELDCVSRIVGRALVLYRRANGRCLDSMSTEMDVLAAHLNGCPLDLFRLEKFPDFDFMHDVVGIINHIDRKTGKLGDCFVPRCAR